MAMSESPRVRGRFRRWLTEKKSEHKVAPQAPAPPLPEIQQPTELERHRGIVAAGVISLLDLCDEAVATRIGFSRNIREELFVRRPQTKDEKINTNGLDQVVLSHLIPGGFSYRADDDAGDPVEFYHIDYNYGSFDLEVELLRPKGKVAINILTGPTREDYSHVEIMRKYDTNNWRKITTFYPPNNSLGSDHPLVVETSSGTRAYYDNIDTEGNVSLLDGKQIELEFLSGIYSANDQSITPNSGPLHIGLLLPYRGVPRYGDLTDDTLTFTNMYGKKVSIPQRTNLYNEIKKLVPYISFPNLYQ